MSFPIGLVVEDFKGSAVGSKEGVAFSRTAMLENPYRAIPGPRTYLCITVYHRLVQKAGQVTVPSAKCSGVFV